MKQNLGEMAYDALRKKVLNAEAGSYLSARQVAKELNISYTPVREACLRMVQEGSLRLEPNVGFFVQSLNINNLVQIFEVRECIETFVLEKVFDRITPQVLDKLKTLTKKMDGELEKDDIAEYQRLDVQFHLVFFNLYGNALLSDFYSGIRLQFVICSKEVASKQSHRSINEHLDLIDCIEMGDKQKSLESLLAHIGIARKRMSEGYIQIFKESV